MRSVKEFEESLKGIKDRIDGIKDKWKSLKADVADSKPYKAAANAMDIARGKIDKMAASWYKIEGRMKVVLSLTRSIAMASLPLKMLNSVVGALNGYGVDADNGSGDRRFKASGLKSSSKNILALERAESLNKTNSMYENFGTSLQRALLDVESWGGLATLGLDANKYKNLDGVDALFKVLGDIDSFYKKHGGINESTTAATKEGLGVLGLDENSLRQILQFRGEVQGDYAKSRSGIKFDDAKLRSSEKALESLNIAIENAKYKFLEFIGPTLDKVAKIIERWISGDFGAVIKDLQTFFGNFRAALKDFRPAELLKPLWEALGKAFGENIDFEKMFNFGAIGPVFDWLINLFGRMKPALNVLLKGFELLSDGIRAVMRAILGALRWVSEKTGISIITAEEYKAVVDATKTSKEIAAERAEREALAYKGLDAVIGIAEKAGFGDVAKSIRTIKSADEKAKEVVILTKAADNKVLFAVANADSGDRITEWETLVQMEARALKGFK